MLDAVLDDCQPETYTVSRCLAICVTWTGSSLAGAKEGAEGRSVVSAQSDGWTAVEREREGAGKPATHAPYVWLTSPFLNLCSRSEYCHPGPPVCAKRQSAQAALQGSSTKAHDGRTSFLPIASLG